MSTLGTSDTCSSRKTSSTSPERAPSIPRVRPACERSWQGNPAVTSSVHLGSRFISRTSPASGLRDTGHRGRPAPPGRTRKGQAARSPLVRVLARFHQLRQRGLRPSCWKCTRPHREVRGHDMRPQGISSRCARNATTPRRGGGSSVGSVGLSGAGARGGAAGPLSSPCRRRRPRGPSPSSP